MGRITRSRGAAAVIVALAVVLTGGLPAHAAPQPDFPTWEEVERARADEAATASAISRIEGILGELEAEVDELGRTAQLRAEEAAIAQEELAAAEARAADLADSVEQAEQRADDSARRAGQILARIARTGGGDVTLELLFAPGAEVEDLLSSLGTMTRISQSSAALIERAVYDRNTARSLGDQAAVAESRRASLAVEAQRAAEQAERAMATAAARVEEQQAAASELYAQLARLKNSTAELEREYREGQAWQEENQPPTDPAPSQPGPADPGSGDPGPSDPTPSDPGPADPKPSQPSPPAPVPSKVAGAIEYAKAQLGEPYAWGGAGPDRWDCSGLTLKSWQSVGVSIGPHGSTSQYNTLKNSGRLVSIDHLAAGDLLFYSNGGSTSGTKYHVTMYIGDGKMIEAPYAGQVVRIVPVRSFDLVPYVGRPTA